MDTAHDYVIDQVCWWQSAVPSLQCDTLQLAHLRVKIRF